MRSARTMTFKQSVIGTAALIFVGCLPAAEGYGLELKPNEIRAKTYEKPVAVLQKRYFRKELRPELGLVFGGFLNEAYTETEKRGARLSLFLNEWIGLEAQYIDTSVSSSDDKKALTQLKFKKAKPEKGEDPDKLVSPQPEVNKISTIIDFNAVIAPFYGKLNLFDYMIIYLDTYLTLGGAMIESDQGDKNAISYGIGQRYYFFQSLSLRVDFRNHSFTEKRGGKSTTRNQQSWDVGISWFFL